MIPSAFDYVKPASLSAALQEIARLGEEGRLMAGGHSLLPMMKVRLSSPGTLIDIGGLEELKGIQVKEDEVFIGATTTHAALEHHADLARALPLIPMVAHQIADPTVRNRGTIGGALANADPSADWPAAMLALDATIETISAQGKRAIPVDAFFKGLFETELRSNEVIVGIRIPLKPGLHGAYRKFRHPASGYAVAGVAVALFFEGKHCSGGRIAVTGFSSHPFRAKRAEAALAWYDGGPQQTERLLDMAFPEIPPLEDRFADAEYRTQLARTMLRRALSDATLDRPGT